jgi:hypothetical protein
MRIVSMGEREIFPLMKWEKILDLTKVSLFIFIPSLVTLGVYIVPLGATSTGILRLGIRV